ncbi:Transcriptional regulator, LysR family [plant metagenome]|uniref:Transcriptional regulator, LysR family n=1 Tax=plant metagenome TaxID=1297885 RepID=A0A484U0Y1_9ZZZZ
MPAAPLLSRLKHRHLLLLTDLAELGTLTRAAARAGVSQPAATKTLAELETIFGAPLFVRGGARLTPTDLGRQAIVRAHQMLRDLENWQREMEASRAGLRGHLHIGAVPYVSGDFLAQALATLHREHGVASTLTRATSDQLGRALANHDIDCLIGRASAAALGPEYQHEQLFTQKPTLIAHPRLARRLAQRLPDWGELSRMNWILPSPATPTGMIVAELFAQAQVAAPVPIVETYSLDIIAGMLRDDATLLSILPESVARDMARRGDIGLVDWDLGWMLPPVTLIRRRRDTPQPAEEQLAEILRALCATMR